MPLQMIREDITRMKTDAIVNAANHTLMGGGGVDGCIHRAAGPELQQACSKLGGCPTGEARITPGFRLPCKYIIHTVGPVWQGGSQGEPELLRACYRNSLALAAAHHCRSIAFPLISAGAYGYPKRQALNIAVETIRSVLTRQEQDMLVYLVLLDTAFIAREEPCSTELPGVIREIRSGRSAPVHRNHDLPGRYTARSCAPCILPEEDSFPAKGFCASTTLNNRLAKLDESFSQMLLRKIDELGISDAACYKRANTDRKLFSKIRSDVHYRPSKTTAVAFAIALELNRQETDELLRKAGFALSDSSKFDIIIQYFISKGNYDIFEINEALFAFDQPLLGSR